MPKVDWVTLKMIENAVQMYEQAVDESPLKPGPKYDYKKYVRRFVRWLNDEYEPGETKRAE